MRMIVLAIAGALLAGSALANDVYGTWQTQKNDEGKYLHVDVQPCADDAAKVCGTIIGAFGGANEANIGKRLIWDMVPDDEPNEWDNGQIWKADEDKVYDSEMELNGDILTVSGCILGGLICKSQEWPRVK